MRYEVRSARVAMNSASKDDVTRDRGYPVTFPRPQLKSSVWSLYMCRHKHCVAHFANGSEGSNRQLSFVGA
jgi:hypothetical protein